MLVAFFNVCKARSYLQCLTPLYVVCFMIAGCSGLVTQPRSANVNFLKNVVGDVVLEYYRKHGHMPDGIEEALVATNRTLPNRGDVHGHSLLYIKESDDTFVLMSAGANNRFEAGLGDDVVLKCSSRSWSEVEDGYSRRDPRLP